MKPTSVFFRTQHNYDLSESSTDSGLCCSDVSLAVQSERDECDINVIVERFGVTGVAPMPSRLPKYGDFEGIFDFQSAMAVVIDAQSAFMDLPAKVRARFSNDPQEFLQFVEDPNNADELVRLGLAEQVPAPASSQPAAAVDASTAGGG